MLSFQIDGRTGKTDVSECEATREDVVTMDTCAAAAGAAQSRAAFTPTLALLFSQSWSVVKSELCAFRVSGMMLQKC